MKSEGVGSIPTAETKKLMIMEEENVITIEEDSLAAIAYSILPQISMLLEAIKKANLTNEQWVLDWLDRLNMLSVRY